MNYLLLMRHGAYESESNAESSPQRVLTTKGRQQIEEVARKFRELIVETKEVPEHKIVLKQIWYAVTPEAKCTAFIQAALSRARTEARQSRLM
jgi:broad specificity phosphatase PhoE